MVGSPAFGGEDFYFVVAGEAGGFDAVADVFEGDAAFAHEATVVEEVAGVGAPVGDVEGEEGFLLGGELDFFFEVGVPPGVVDVEGDAEPRGAVVFADVAGLGEGVDGGAVGGVHGVEGFDGEFDVVGLGVGEERADGVADLGAGGGEREAADGAADEDEEGCADGGGLVDGAAVVVEGGLALGGLEGGEESAASEGDDGEAGVGEHFGGSGGADGIEDVSPDGDGGDVGVGVGVDALVEGPGVVGHGVDGEAGEVGEGLGHGEAHSWPAPGLGVWLRMNSSSGRACKSLGLPAARLASIKADRSRILIARP